MFASKPGTEIVFRALLIAIILFNALAPITVSASPLSGKNESEAGIAEIDNSSAKDIPTHSKETVDQTQTLPPELRDLALPTETPVPSATTTPEDPATAAPGISLFADPDFITAGGMLLLNWEIDGIVIEDHKLLSVQIILPDGFSLDGKYEGTYDEITHTLTITITTALSGQVNLITSNAVSDSKMQAFLKEDSEILAEASLFLPVHEQFLLDQQGGEIAVDDGKIKIEFPENVLSEQAVIEVGAPSEDAMPPYSLLGKPFEIKAHEKQSGEELNQFSKKISIRVSYADLGIPKELDDDLYLYWYNPEIEDWEALPSIVDTKTQTLEAYTDHFTVFDMDVTNWQASHLPTVEPFQVSTFTGAATYSLPIEVPPGPGGFQPSLSLNYNSQIVDQSTTKTQASWVGMGWSLETGSIELDTHGTDINWPYDDTYLLNVGGISTRIVTDTNGVYHAADENFWRIEYAGDKWTVKDKQGNTYYFEIVSQYPRQTGTCTGGNAGVSWTSYRWSLTKVTNIFAQEILYTYVPQYSTVRMDSCVGSQYSVSAVYPDTITYANGKYRIRFDRGGVQNRWDFVSTWDNDVTFHAFEKYRLKNIYIEQVNGAEVTVIRRYQFDYAADTDADIIFPGVTWTAGGKTTTLRSVTEYGVGGTTTSLPPVTFTYGDNLHLTEATNGYGATTYFWYELWYYSGDARPSNTIYVDFGISGYPCASESSAPWSARTGIVDCGDGDNDPLKIRGPLGIATADSIKNETSSPYQNPSKDLVRPGGVYKITANIGLQAGMSARLGLNDGTGDRWGNSGALTAFITLSAGASRVIPLIEETGGDLSTKAASVGDYKFQLLTSVYRVTTKGVQDGQGNYYKTVYSYNNDAGADTGTVNTVGAYAETYSEFRGHGQVTQTDQSWYGGAFTTHGTTVTSFYQDNILKGRPSAIATYDGSLVSQITNYYGSALLPCSAICSTYGAQRSWVWTSSVVNSVYSTNGAHNGYTNTLYEYEPTYGNLITQTERAWDRDVWDWVTYRITTTDYYPNAAAYLVGLPAVQTIWDASGAALAQIVNTYDSNSTYAAPPTVGKLSAVRTWVETTGSTVKYSLITYGYDQWGNRTTVTGYSEYAIGANSIPATGAQTTTTVFDSTYHTYPISQTTPATQNSPSGLTTTWTYDYTRSVPLTETDPNGNSTSAQYDTFGRMTKLIRPGDDSANPTVAIDYHDTNPFWTEIRQRIDTTRYATIRRIYDGIGRPTKIEKGSSPAGAGTFTLDNTVSFQYPTLSMAKQSMPYASGGTTFYTTTVSDVVGRPLTITAPNGNATSYAYDGLATTITDPKENITTTTTDVWGRVITVTPPTGPDVTYTYDVLNNLKTATRGGVTTEIKYDYAGRKIGMDDPDMGMAGVIGDDLWGWKYEYDGLGNLTRQTDARGCVITLGYDLLNRLTTKTSSGAGCNTQVNTTFAYDTGVNGKGRRTSMNDGSGSTSWQYDLRGRAQNEVKTINGAAGPFTTSWLYNSADLPISMTYPDNETLTYAYNDNGLLDTITSSLGNTYLADTQYDPAGRITSMDYGASVLRKTFDYFAWNTADQGGLLNTAVTTRLADSITLQNFAYAYDQNANIETIIDSLAGPQTQTFAYDSLNRLTSAVVTGGTDGLYNESYTYNASTGNLASKAGVNYTYDPNHVHAVASLSNGNTYQYDENGNMTDRNVGALTFDLAYDAENRLVSVTGNGAPPPTSTPSSVPTSTFTPTATKTNTPTPTPTATQTLGGHTPTFTPTPTQTNTPTATATPSQTNTPGGPTETFTPSPTPGSDLIFADGFESGDLSAWTSSSTDGGDMSTSAAATLHGSYGLQAVIDDINAIYLTDDNPNAEPRYRARFYFDPNSLTMASGDAHFIFKGFSGASTDVFQVEFRYSSGNYELRVRALNDASAWTNTNWIVLSDAAQYIEVDWRAATAVGANDGGLTLWIDGTQQADLTGMDNDTWRVDRARLGALSSLDAGTSGTYYFDAFESRRSSYIGAIALAPSMHFAGYKFIPPQQSGSLSFTPSDDAYIESSLPTTNYGSATTVQVDNSPVKHFLLKFDVTGINSGQVTNAKLCLYNKNGATEGGDFYPVSDDSWQEETVTWNTAPAAETTLLASLGSVSPNTWYEVDLTSHITADGSYSVRVSDSVGGADYSSKEGSNDPKLLVSLAGEPAQSCTPAATATPTLGPTNTPTNTSTPGPSPTPTFAPTSTATVPPSAPFNSATFVYDGDGKRVKSTFNGTTTTYFVGAHYEVAGSTITKYYYAGSKRIAMRTNGTLSYLLGDHLGSTSLTTNASGQVVSELRYTAWGETRYSSGNMATKYQYTGQYSYTSDFGLLFYNTRWYDPALSRFAQADTVIPLGQGVQAWDRYAYTNNNPIRFTDPSGHCIRCVVVTTTVITAGSFILSAVGATPDYVGAVTTMALTDTNDAVVAAGLTVQSQYPWAMFIGSGRGMSQIPQDKIDHLLDPDGQNPYSPSVAVEAMDRLINQEIDDCKQLCSTGVDKLIVAAIAQNGYQLDFSSLPRTPENTINWDMFFESNVGSGTSDLFAQIRQEVTGMDYSAEFMLKLYIQDLRLLMKFGHDLPAWAEEKDVKYIEDNYLRNKDK